MIHRMNSSRCSWTNRLFVGPVLVILPTLIDPSAEQFDFLFGQRVSPSGGMISSSSGSSPIRKIISLSSHPPGSKRHSPPSLQSHRQKVSSLSPASRCSSSAVTGNTLIGEDGLDLGIKIHLLFGKRCRCSNDSKYPVNSHNFHFK